MIIGDLNISIIGVNVINNDYLDILSEHGFRSFIDVHIKTPLGCTHSCLDHIFIKLINYVDNRIKSRCYPNYYFLLLLNSNGFRIIKEQIFVFL